MIDSQPLALLPRETALLDRETLTLIRPVEPQPTKDEKYAGGLVIETPEAVWSLESVALGCYPEALPFIPGVRYYVQEEWRADWELCGGTSIAWAHLKSSPERRWFVDRLEDAMPGDHPASTMPIELARHHLTCESVEVKQLKDATHVEMSQSDLIYIPALPDLWVVAARFRREDNG